MTAHREVTTLARAGVIGLVALLGAGCVAPAARDHPSLIGTWRGTVLVEHPATPGACSVTDGYVEYRAGGELVFEGIYTFLDYEGRSVTVPLQITGTWTLSDGVLRETLTAVDASPAPGMAYAGDPVLLEQAVEQSVPRGRPSAYELVRLSEQELIVKDLHTGAVSRLTR